MKRLFLVAVMALLAIASVDAQSKKELKAMAKRQETIKATTDEEGARFLINKNYSHTIKPTVTSCTRSGSTVKIDMMVWNTSEDKDVTLKFFGTGYGYSDTKAEDNLGNVYNGGKTRCITVDFRGAKDKYIYYSSDPVFVPAGAPAKVTLSIKGVDRHATQFNEFAFVIHSSSNNVGMKFTCLDLPIE